MIYDIAKLVVNFFLLLTGDNMSRPCRIGQGHGHSIIKISQNIGHVHTLCLNI